MRTFLSSLKYFSKMIIRDKMTVIVYLVFPLVLIFILGSVFKSNDIDIKIDKANVAIVTPANNEELSIILKSSSLSNLLNTYEVEEAEAIRGLSNKEYDSILYLYVDSTKMVVLDSSKLQNTIVKSIVESYEKIKSAFKVLIDENNVDSIISANNLDLEANYIYNSNIIKDKPKSSMDYYGITIVIMLMLYGGLITVELFEKNVIGSIASRVNISTSNKTFIISGMLASALLITILQTVIVILFTGIVYKVNWGNDYLIILLSILGACLFANLMAMNYLLLTKNGGIAITLSVMTAIISSFFSGGYAQIDFGNAQKIFNYLPSAVAQNTIFSSIYGGNVMKNLSILFLYSLIALIIFLPLSRRKMK